MPRDTARGTAALIAGAIGVVTEEAGGVDAHWRGERLRPKAGLSYRAAKRGVDRRMDYFAAALWPLELRPKTRERAWPV